jgi:hypothetical protein
MEGFEEFYKMWQSEGKDWKKFLVWVQSVRHCEDEVFFLKAVEEYCKKPSWKKLDYIVDTYLDKIDVVGDNAKQALMLRESKDRSKDPPKNVFFLQYVWIMQSLQGEYLSFVQWREGKKQ